ncbi:MAG TPA: DUF4231 domain-containing protein [Bacteroidia bacterium]|nr:DUF4231 domain-containing protein [Bacteroidia bacterium]
MDAINPDQYLTSRVDDQINWMEGKSATNQKRYKQFKRAEIILAASVPLLIGFHKYGLGFSIFAGVISSIVIILISMQQLHKYYENWISYRNTIEKLRREKYLFTTGSGPYAIDEDDPAKQAKETERKYRIFVETIEGILASENENWKNTGRQKPDNPA